MTYYIHCPASFIILISRSSMNQAIIKAKSSHTTHTSMHVPVPALVSVPVPNNFVPMEPVAFQSFQQYQFIQVEMPAFQSPKLQSTDQPGIAVCSSNSLMVLTWSLEHPIKDLFF